MKSPQSFTFNFTHPGKESQGNFIGVDINNNIVSGTLLIKPHD